MLQNFKMKLNTNFPKNEDGLTMLLKSIFNINEQRSLWAVRQSNMSLKEIEDFDIYVSELMWRLRKEYRRFKDDAEDYIQTFVLEDNNCINAHRLVFKDIHHSLVGVRNIMIKLSAYKGIHSNKYQGVATPVLYENTHLSNKMPWSVDLFDSKEYGSSVCQLCNNIVEYFQLLYEVIDKCFELLHDERIVKSDAIQVHNIYLMYEDAVIKEFSEHKELYGITPAQLNNMLNPLYERRKEYEDDFSFEQDIYHNEQPIYVKAYILQKKYCNKKASDITPEEHVLFGDDAEKVRKIRLVIANFNHLAHKPQRGELKKLDAKSIACFASYCSVCGDKKSIYAFYLYFLTMYKKSEGAVGVVVNERVYKAMSQLTPTDRREFNNKLENLVFELENNYSNISSS